MRKRALWAVAAAGMVLGPAARAETAPSSALPAMLAAGRIVLVQFRTQDCRVCVPQNEALGRIARDRASWVPTVVQVDMEAESELKDRYKITNPATILLLVGEMEMARVGELQTEEQIRQFIGIWASKARGIPGRRPKRAARPKL